jgi:hypothetical protein
MVKRSSKKIDVNVLATNIVEQATKSDSIGITLDSIEKNPNAVALGHLGGLKGGKARAKKLTPEQRKEIARKAAQKRWAK